MHFIQTLSGEVNGEDAIDDETTSENQSDFPMAAKE